MAKVRALISGLLVFANIRNRRACRYIIASYCKAGLSIDAIEARNGLDPSVKLGWCHCPNLGEAALYAFENCLF